MTHDNDRRQDVRSITVRIPKNDYLVLREHADARDVSMNVVISEAVSEYGARISRRQALDRIRSLQARLQRDRQVGSDSVQLLREVREDRNGPKGGRRP